VPESRRIEAGVILQTSSPLGIVLASAVNYQVAGVWLAGSPESSWRYVFLAGLAPVILAFAVRLFIRESEHWTASSNVVAPPSPRELFRPNMLALTLSGFVVAVTALLTWWACNAFLPLLGGTLASEHAAQAGLTPTATRLLIEAWKAKASNAFNFGGLLGSLAAIPLARRLGRRPMFVAYFLYSAAALFATFGLDLEPQARLRMLYLVGAGVYGVFGTFSFYLPELFPARLRATGAGFCYNIGRVFAAVGPFIVGSISAASGGSRNRAIMVGDSETDIKTAQAAGVPVIAVDFGYADTPVRELGPDRVISHFDELMEACEAISLAGQWPEVARTRDQQEEVQTQACVATCWGARH